MAKRTKAKNKNILTLFILCFPSVLIAMIPSVNIYIFDASVVYKFLIVFYQFILIKNFIDDYYEKIALSKLKPK